MPGDDHAGAGAVGAGDARRVAVPVEHRDMRGGAERVAGAGDRGPRGRPSAAPRCVPSASSTCGAGEEPLGEAVGSCRRWWKSPGAHVVGLLHHLRQQRQRVGLREVAWRASLEQRERVARSGCRPTTAARWSAPRGRGRRVRTGSRSITGRRRGPRRRGGRRARSTQSLTARAAVAAVDPVAALRGEPLERVGEIREAEEVAGLEQPSLRRVERAGLGLAGDDGPQQVEDVGLLGRPPRTPSRASARQRAPTSSSNGIEQKPLADLPEPRRPCRGRRTRTGRR